MTSNPFESAARFVNDMTFTRVNTVVPSGWLQHGPFALWIATALRPMLYVELGTHSGYSFFAMCQAIKEARLPCKAVAIDTWRGDEHAGFYDDSVFRAVESLRKTQYDGIATLHRSTFDDALPSIVDGSVDLLHIDGFHTYDAVKHDYESWLPKMSRTGIILFHDIAVTDRGFEVKRLWSELAAEYPNFSFTHGNGLGVLKVGGEPTPVDGLFQVGSDVRDIVRMIYQALGERTAQQLEIEAQNRRLASVMEDFSALRSSLSWRGTAPLRAILSRLRT